MPSITRHCLRGPQCIWFSLAAFCAFGQTYGDTCPSLPYHSLVSLPEKSPVLACSPSSQTAAPGLAACPQPRPQNAAGPSMPPFGLAAFAWEHASGLLPVFSWRLNSFPLGPKHIPLSEQSTLAPIGLKALSCPWNGGEPGPGDTTAPVVRFGIHCPRKDTENGI